MPTFNKNKDSLAADINGTFAGPDGDPATDNDRYGDYVNYTLGEQKTGSAVYDADADEEDEGEAAVEGVDIETREETHAAKATQNATVLSMAEWKAQGAPRRQVLGVRYGWLGVLGGSDPARGGYGHAAGWDRAAKESHRLVLCHQSHCAVRHGGRPGQQNRQRRLLPGGHDRRRASPALGHFREPSRHGEGGQGR
ncbi:MAG: hypothetical protein ACLR23_05495 [Clostridia bacterium]